MRESTTWKKPGGSPFLEDETAPWRVALETVSDLVARWGPIVVVVCVIVPATALAADGEAGQYDRLVALLTALGVAAGNVYSAWNTARMKAQIRQIGKRRRPVAVRRGPGPLRSAGVAVRIHTPSASPAGLGTIERLDQRVTGLEASVGALGKDLHDVKRDLSEVLDILTGGRRP